MPRKVLAKRRLLKELYVEGIFVEHRAVWKDELPRRCEEVYDDQEETAEKQKERIMKFKMAGDKPVTEDGRIAEVTVALVLKKTWPRSQKKTSMDWAVSIVAEMIQELPLVGQEGRTAGLVLLRSFNTELKKGSRSYGETALTSSNVDMVRNACGVAGQKKTHSKATRKDTRCTLVLRHQGGL